MLVKIWEDDPRTFAILTDITHVRRIAQVASADECVTSLCFAPDWPFVGGDGPYIEVTLDYAPADGGAEEIANAWLAASALLPEVVL